MSPCLLGEGTASSTFLHWIAAENTDSMLDLVFDRYRCINAANKWGKLYVLNVYTTIMTHRFPTGNFTLLMELSRPFKFSSECIQYRDEDEKEPTLA